MKNIYKFTLTAIIQSQTNNLQIYMNTICPIYVWNTFRVSLSQVMIVLFTAQAQGALVNCTLPYIIFMDNYCNFALLATIYTVLLDL